MIPKLNSAHGSDTRNIINRAIEVLNRLGIDVQTLVAEGQLTDKQYAELISLVNRNLKSGEVDKNDLSQDFINYIENKRDVNESIKLDELAEDVLSAISGGATFSLLSVPRDQSVTPEKTTFIQKSSNLFNKDDVVNGQSIDENGEVTENHMYNIQFGIPVDAGREYTKNSQGRISFKTRDGGFIESHWVSSSNDFLTVSAPENSAFVDITVRNVDLNIAQFNKGSVVLPYEPYYKPYLKNDIGINVDKNDVSPEILSGKVMKTISNNTSYAIDFNDKKLTLRNVVVVYGGKRYYITASDVDDVNFTFSDNQTYLILVDVSKSVGAQKTDINQVIRIIQHTYIDDIKRDEVVVGGFNPSTKEMYNLENITVIGGNNKAPEYKNKRVLEITDLIETKEMQDASSSGLNIQYYKSQDVFDAYDNEIVAATNGYVEKELFLTEQSGLPIYRYNFRPQRTRILRTSEKTKRPHFFLLAGVHPGERVGWWGLFQALKRIATEWKDDPMLSALRWGLDISVIPILNVYGMDNGYISGNANLIDINRNFPAGWVEISTPGQHGYSGTEPASELETQALIDVLQNEQVDYYGDFHNFFGGGAGNENEFNWNIGSNMWNIEIAEMLFTHISQKWKRENPDFPQDENILHGYVSTTDGGTPPEYCKSIGVNGSVFECRNGVGFESNPKDLNAKTITLASDSILNWLYQMYRNVVNN